MKVASLKNPVKASWLWEHNDRLDAQLHLSDGVEATKRLRAADLSKHELSAVTENGIEGIFHAGREGRSWVNDPSVGVPFLGSTDILASDLTRLPLLSRRQIAANPRFLIRKGWTLITRSGTIGRMAYTRAEMDGLACSEHVLRVVPDREKILPGFLYAFLRSRFGVSQITGGTYGSIIQSIEPGHISHILVPRLGTRIEEQVHGLVEEAASGRTRAGELLRQAQSELSRQLRLPESIPEHRYPHPLISMCRSSFFATRGDAFYFAPMNIEARSAFDSAPAPSKPLAEVAEVFIPNIFKRLYADDSRYGYPYLTGAEVFELAPKSDKYLLRAVAESNHLVLRKGMIVVQEAGQLGGLIGRAVLVGEYLDGFACTNNMVRVSPKDPDDAGYLFAVLASEYGHRLIAREGAGSSIPHLEAGRVAGIGIPWATVRVRRQIGELVMTAVELRDEANSKEMQTQMIVEGAIERAV